MRRLRVVNGLLVDIDAVRSLNLQELRLEKCYYLHDLGPIAECQGLERLLIPSHVDAIEFLQELPHLKILANNVDDFDRGQTPEEFWKKREVAEE